MAAPTSTGSKPSSSFTKRRLAKFNGVKINFELHLKECEWRYNKSSSLLIQNLLNLIEN